MTTDTVTVRCNKHGMICTRDEKLHIVHAKSDLFCDSPFFTVAPSFTVTNRATTNAIFLIEEMKHEARTAVRPDTS